MEYEHRRRSGIGGKDSGFGVLGPVLLAKCQRLRDETYTVNHSKPEIVVHQNSCPRT